MTNGGQPLGKCNRGEIVGIGEGAITNLLYRLGDGDANKFIGVVKGVRTDSGNLAVERNHTYTISIYIRYNLCSEIICSVWLQYAMIRGGVGYLKICYLILGYGGKRDVVRGNIDIAILDAQAHTRTLHTGKEVVTEVLARGLDGYNALLGIGHTREYRQVDKLRSTSCGIGSL